MLTIQKIKAMKKIKEEFKELSTHPLGDIGVTVGLSDENNLFKWRATINGPKDTSYSGGMYLYEIYFPDNYPEMPPEICFRTPIYHLNVNPFKPKNNAKTNENLGYVSLNILNFWKPEYTLKEVLFHLFYLFYKPNPDCCYGLERAYEFKENKDLYEKKIKYFTKKYARPSSYK